MDNKELFELKTKHIEIKTEETEQQQNQVQMLQQQMQPVHEEKHDAFNIIADEQKEQDVNVNEIQNEQIQEDNLTDVKQRDSWKNTSQVAQERKSALIGDAKMTEEMKEGYVKEYKKSMNEGDDGETHEVIKLDEKEVQKNELNEKIKNMVQKLKNTVYTDINEDVAKASDSFINMKLAVNKFVMLCDNNSASSASEYGEALNNLVNKANEYLSSHKSRRFTERGAKRQKMANDILGQVDSFSKGFVASVLKLRALEENNYQETDEKKEKRDKLRDYIFDEKNNQFSLKEYKKISENGTVEDKIKALMNINKYYEYCNICYDFLEKEGKIFDVAEFEKISETMYDALLKSHNPADKIKLTDLVVDLSTSLNQKCVELYDKYYNEAPEGADPDVYAQSKIKNSEFYAQVRSLENLKKEMMETDDDMYFVILNRSLKMPNKEKIDVVMDKTINKSESSMAKKDANTYVNNYYEIIKEDYADLLGTNLVKDNKKAKVNKVSDRNKMIKDLINFQNIVSFVPKNANGMAELKKEVLSKNIATYTKEDYANALNKEEINRIVTQGSVEEKISILANFYALKDKLSKNYTEAFKQIINSFKAMTLTDKMQVSKALYGLKLRAMKMAQKSFGMDPEVNFDEMCENSQMMLMYEQVVQALKGEVPEIVEGAEKTIENHMGLLKLRHERVKVLDADENAADMQEQAESVYDTVKKTSASKKKKYSNVILSKYGIDYAGLKEIGVYRYDNKELEADKKQLNNFYSKIKGEKIFGKTAKLLNKLSKLSTLTEENIENMKEKDILNFSQILSDLENEKRHLESIHNVWNTHIADDFEFEDKDRYLDMINEKTDKERGEFNKEFAMLGKVLEEYKNIFNSIVK